MQKMDVREPQEPLEEFHAVPFMRFPLKVKPRGNRMDLCGPPAPHVVQEPHGNRGNRMELKGVFFDAPKR